VERESRETLTYDIVASIVIFETSEREVLSIVDLLVATKLRIRIVIVDNSLKSIYRSIRNHSSVDYIRTGKNIGYGAANNLAIEKYRSETKYFLILNSDVSFLSGTLESIFGFMNRNPEVAHCMPRVIGKDNTLQYCCRLLPNPAVIFARAFLRWNPLQRLINTRYELRNLQYDKTIDAPFLSGCFMFLRAEALEIVGGFDERFFLYAEDIDLTRRFHMRFRTVLFPGATIAHSHRKESFRNWKMFILHIQSMTRYFNKWGWFIDHDRRTINRRCRSQVQNAIES
jgi:GT2 family glycosyltransferase